MAMEGPGPGRSPFFYGPDGRLIQVDAALEAVRRGSPTVGLKTKDYAILASQVRPARPLMQPAEKIFTLDDHAGATGSGYVGDLMHLIEEARVQAQRHRLVYDTPMDILSLAKHIGRYFHSFTLYTVRPPGASLILTGADPLGIQLYQVEPGGTYFSGQAAAVGQESEKALEVMTQGYREDMSLEEGIELARKAIGAAAEGEISVDYGIVKKSEGTFEKRSAS